MTLRLPGSGLVLEALLTGLGRGPNQVDGDAVDSVTEEQLKEALNAMARGDIEFVILEDGEEFLQAAGDGEGPYAVEHHPVSGPQVAVTGGLDRAAMTAALLAYRRGDPAWRRTGPWQEI